MIMENSASTEIDLNSKLNNGWTAFHLACWHGHIRIVDMMIEHSESLELDLKAKDSYGKTGYQWAKGNGRTAVVNLIQTRMPHLAV